MTPDPTGRAGARPFQRGGTRHPGSTIARHGKLRPRKALGAVLRFLAAAVAVLLVSTASVAAIAFVQLQNNLDIVDLPGRGEQEFDIADYPGGFNLLLVGADVRAGQSGNYGEYDPDAPELNDVNILVHVSGDHSRATAVSIPRDLLVPMPECTAEDGTVNPADESEQINRALERGGLPCVVSTIEQLTGLTIQFAGRITFDGVIAMSNAVGGVEVCLTDPLEDENVELALDAGTHTLQGADALKFLRSRYGVGDGGDLGRISSQQVFLSSLVRKITSEGVLNDPLQVYSLASAATQNMQLTEGVDTVASLAWTLRNLRPADVTFVSYPSAQSTVDTNRLEPVEDQAAELMRYLDEDLPFGVGQTGSSATVDPNAPAPSEPAEEPSAAPSETAAPSGSASPTETPAPTEPPVLEGITGQTADQQTCTVPG
ncbi:LCP family glycopolymer transferase [Herbiconiux sp. SYSU D00978]|uniref:LCP family glycopolymer transferase n=1 Tax=Herbiconiux sp. SYSU D00978 TaxID=2812562 RepID=UPI001A9580A2|nr:LCP family protein [Herbiconiux sp. SYSU D00978]